MTGRLSSEEREFATLVAQLRALEDDIKAARHAAQRAREMRGVDRDAPHESGPALRGERVTLADGARIVVRPIEPEDADDFAVAFRRLSALSRFRRFGERVDRLTPQQLIAATRVDHESHEALVAFDETTGEGIGEARYVRAPDDLRRAEVSCTILDPWQHRGVGSALVERLAARARAAGIERCTAHIILGDAPARRLLAHIADELDESSDGAMFVITAQARKQRPDQ
jgi:RimJ/RimL family protein N-acetyltransferase